MISSNSINISHINARSINNKFHKINSLIVEHNIHILCISETWLNKETKYLDLPSNYDIIRNDRIGKKGGGVAIIYKSIFNLSNINTSYTETIITTVSSPKLSNDNFTLILSYCEPKSRCNFDFIYHHLNSSNANTIILGDFNAKHQSWFCSNQNNRGTRLDKIVSEFNINILNDSQPTNDRSVIDLVLTTADLVSKTNNFSILHENISDHKAIIFKLVFKLKNIKETIQLHGLTDWTAFKNSVSVLCQTINHQNIDNIDQTNNQIVSAIKSSYDLATPTKDIRVNSKARYTIPKPILELKKLKNKFRKLWQSTRANIYKNLMNNANNKLKRRISELKSLNWNSLCESITASSNNSAKMWNKIRNIDGAKSKKTIHLPGLNISEQDKTELFADHFSKVFSNSNNSTINTSTLALMSNESECPQISISELEINLKTINKKSCPGLDQITGKMLVNLPQNCLEAILKIFNYSLKNCILPQAWKDSKIILIPKKDSNLNQPNAYRPISLTSCIVKLLEKIIMSRLITFIESNKILTQFQSGFRENRSTQDNIIRITHDIKHGFSSNKKTCLVLFDVEKAFDKCCHSKLIEALIRHKIPIHLVKWVKAFLTNRNFMISIDNKLSSPKPITAGTPQGSLLSPILFALFINDIAHITSDSPVKISLFADDIAIWFSHKNINVVKSNIQPIIDCIHDFCNKNNLKLNVKKTSYTIFARNGYRLDYLRNSTMNLNIGADKISRDLNPRILGIIFDPGLTFKKHFSMLTEKCNNSINLIRVLSHHGKGISKANLIKVYNAYIRSLFNYSFIPFLLTSSSIKKDLQIIQNNALRFITGMNKFTHIKISYLHYVCNMPLVSEIVDKALNKYMIKVASHQELRNLMCPLYEESININNSKFFTPFNYPRFSLLES